MIFRGALTNGHTWIFLALILNEDGDGGKYFQSYSFKVWDANDGISSVSHGGSSLIAAIIAHWVGNCDVSLQIAEYVVLCVSDPA